MLSKRVYNGKPGRRRVAMMRYVEPRWRTTEDPPEKGEEFQAYVGRVRDPVAIINQ